MDMTSKSFAILMTTGFGVNRAQCRRKAEFMIIRMSAESAGGVKARFSYDQQHKLLSSPLNPATGETQEQRVNHSCVNSYQWVINKILKLCSVLPFCRFEKPHLSPLIPININ